MLYDYLLLFIIFLMLFIMSQYDVCFSINNDINLKSNIKIKYFTHRDTSLFERERERDRKK